MPARHLRHPVVSSRVVPIQSILFATTVPLALFAFAGANHVGLALGSGDKVLDEALLGFALLAGLHLDALSAQQLDTSLAVLSRLLAGSLRQRRL